MATTTHGGEARASVFGRLVLLRHGQTVWSESGQHTGRTDIRLTDEGRMQACRAGERLRQAFSQGFDADCVFSSPLLRARQTAELAGFSSAHSLDSLMEWDYGRAEGRTRQQVMQASGFAWDVWRDGPHALDPSLDGDWVAGLPSGEQVPVHNGLGESLDEVAHRTRRCIDEVLPLLDSGRDVLLVAHAHVLRILATQWLGVQARMARLFRLDTAHYCVLGRYKGDRVIERWNC